MARKRQSPQPQNNGVMTLSMRQVKAAGATVIFLSAMTGILFGVDARYATAESVTQLRKEIQLISVKARRTTLEDKLFELEQKPKENRTPRDDALIQRYSRELEDVTEIIRSMERKEQ